MDLETPRRVHPGASEALEGVLEHGPKEIARSRRVHKQTTEGDNPIHA
jgi:hypothetical protein